MEPEWLEHSFISISLLAWLDEAAEKTSFCDDGQEGIIRWYFAIMWILTLFFGKGVARKLYWGTGPN